MRALGRCTAVHGACQSGMATGSCSLPWGWVGKQGWLWLFQDVGMRMQLHHTLLQSPRDEMMWAMWHWLPAGVCRDAEVSCQLWS